MIDLLIIHLEKNTITVSKPKMTYSTSLFCPINGPKAKNILKKQQIFTLARLLPDQSFVGIFA